jgi:hypothetical protein
LPDGVVGILDGKRRKIAILAIYFLLVKVRNFTL